MTKEDMMAALEAISKSGIKVAGDLVLEKHVEAMATGAITLRRQNLQISC